MAADKPLTYQRPKGDKCTARAFARGGGDDDNEFVPPSGWEALQHGDLMYEESGYRGTDTWVVTVYGDGSKDIENTGDSAGHAEISAVVSRQIEDPLDFYAADLDDGLCQGVSTIHFDGRAHADILGAAAGGRPVDRSCAVRWATRLGYFEIDAPISPDLPRLSSAPLSGETPDIYLTGALEIPYPDPLVEAERARNQALHSEERASAYFRSLGEGGRVSLTGFPEEKPGGSCGTSGELAWVHPPSGPVTAVGVRHSGEDVYVFAPRLVPFKTGPFGGVKVWAGEGLPGSTRQVWMIRVSP